MMARTLVLCFFFLSCVPFAASAGSQKISSNNKDHLNVATWNIRQTTSEKINNVIKVNNQPTQIYKFIGRWFIEKNIDIFSIQEFYEKYNLESKVLDSPLALLQSQFPSNIKVILGSEIRSPIPRGNNSEWKEYCPIFYNADKVRCTASKDQMVSIGFDFHSLTPTPRYVNWAYCESLKYKFDFVMTCVHTNFKTARQHVLGLKNILADLTERRIEVPLRFSFSNTDFIFAGDFNLDRRSSPVFKDLGFENLLVDGALPIFKKGTRWNKNAFTKLKDIYTFSEAKKKSTDIYDDVAHTSTMNESLISKYADTLIDDYFILNKTNKVDMNSLLNLSDHLPVISSYDMSKDSD